MKGFVEDEINAEMKHRRDAIEYRDAQYLHDMRRAESTESKTVCIVCNHPLMQWEEDGSEFPICIKCL